MNKLLLLCNWIDRTLVIGTPNPGYFNKVSQIKKSKSENDYLTFDFQTSTDGFARVVEFGRLNHQQALHFQKNSTVARVLSANEKDDNLLLTITRLLSRIIQATSSWKVQNLHPRSQGNQLILLL